MKPPTAGASRVNRIELKNIEPPAEIRQAMEKQMKADREKRASILLAEGEKQAAITRAKARRKARSCAPRLSRNRRSREAEGQAQALLLVQKAQADSVRNAQRSCPHAEHARLAQHGSDGEGGRRQGDQDQSCPRDMQNMAATVSAIKALAGDMPAAR